MKKEELYSWGITHESKDLPYEAEQKDHNVAINDMIYNVNTDTAAICHAILLLVDSINDKDMSL